MPQKLVAGVAPIRKLKHPELSIANIDLLHNHKALASNYLFQHEKIFAEQLDHSRDWRCASREHHNGHSK